MHVTKCLILSLTLCLAVVSALEVTTIDDSPADGGAVGDEFASMSAQISSSSFLIEFDQPPAGISRMQRNELDDHEIEQVTAAKRSQASQQHADFQSVLTNDLQVQFQVRHEFFDLLNGMSIDLKDVAPGAIPMILDRIRALPGVVKVSPLVSLNQPKTIVHNVGMGTLAIAPKLSTSHEQTGVLKARYELGLSGKGIKVGIIDTGVDYTHPALGGCYGEGCKVRYGYDFVDFFSGTPGGYDCVGHGTHVAGIIAANSTQNDLYGVAPQAILGSYRVFPCSGSSHDDVIIAALEKAYSDNMDVVNLSLGGGSAWGESSIAQAAGAMSELGIVVVAAIGNDGEQGVSEVSSPSINKDSLSVASFEGASYMSYYFQPENSDSRYDISEKPPAPFIDTPLPLAIAEHDLEGCTPYPSSVEGQVVLIKRGSCTFIEKAKQAQAAGAIGCIFYNNVEGSLRPMLRDPQVSIFGQGVSQQQGLELLQQYYDSNRNLKIIYKSTVAIFDNPAAGQISSFSSWGLGPELELKPDIGAPGGLIYSTVPVQKGSYSTMSGTSMATPFVAGAAALMLESDPTLKPSTVLSQIKSYAHPGNYQSTKVPDTVVRQGAGVVNIYDAIQGKATVQPSHIAWNDTVHRPESVSVTLTNLYDTEEVFGLSHLPAMSVLGYTPAGVPVSKVEYQPTFAEIAMDKTSVRLGPGEATTITLSVSAPPNLPIELHSLFSGYVQIRPTLDSSRPSLKIPYVGMHGTYSTLDVLDMGEGYPVLLGSGKDGPPQPLRDPSTGLGFGTPTVFTMRGRDYVTLMLKISNPIRGLHIYILDREKDAIVGEAPIDGSFLGRTDAAHTKFFSMPWVGRAINSDDRLINVPNGLYSLVVLAPKPFADQSTLVDSEYEIWTSPVMDIRR